MGRGTPDAGDAADGRGAAAPPLGSPFPGGELPELRALQVFLCAAETGSFHKAAARLSITPQGVSKCIRELERRLQLQLFERNRGRTTLTPDGRRLLDALVAPMAALVTVLQDPGRHRHP